MTLGLGNSIGDVYSTKFAHIIILGWPWPNLQQVQTWFLMHLYGKNLDMLIFHKLFKPKS